ncbi:MAG: hypothetical protein WD154_02575 [Nitrosopumilaceae archaeon]
MRLIPTIIVLACIGFAISSAFGATVTFSTDKSTYSSGESIKLTGTIAPIGTGQFVIVQIINPSDSDLVTADQFLPKSDGTFSKTYLADGPKWSQEGAYTLRVFYGEWSETTFQFKKTASVTKPQIPPKEIPKDEKIEEQKQLISFYNEKTMIAGFPDLNNSPNYYLERYNNEPAYKAWFDKTFPGLSIKNIVGYPTTHVQGFPDQDKAPQYYITRYKTDSEFKKWFDSQFSGKTIYVVLQVPQPVQIPSWIKEYASWWSTEQIDDKSFIAGIEFMIKQKIIIIRNLQTSPQESTDDTIPEWVRNNAAWWSAGKITEDDFVNAIEYLVQHGIIKV